MKLDGKISVEEARTRIKAGVSFMSAFVANDINACRKFLDPSSESGQFNLVPNETGIADYDDVTGVGQVAGDLPMGTGNDLSSAMLTKLAATTINDPDWHVVAKKQDVDEQGLPKMVEDTEAAEIGRQYLRDTWKKQCIKRVMEMALLKCDVSGLGGICHAWDEDKRTTYTEHVQSWNLTVDKYVKDWNNLEFGGKLVHMSLRNAAKRYGAPFTDRIKQDKQNADTEKVKVWVCWDELTELHLWDNGDNMYTLLNKGKTDNQYRRVPFRFLQGDPHPGPTPFPLGLGVICGGSQAELADMNLYVSNTARHGAAMTFVHPESLSAGVWDKLKDGQTQEILSLEAQWNTETPAVFRVPSEELSGAVLENKREARNDLRALMGIGAGDLGLFDQQPKFATEVAYVARQGGARQNRARKLYETSLDQWAEDEIQLVVAFGGKYEIDGVDVTTEEEKALHEALSKIVQVNVVESSTLFRDPGMEQQQSLQMLTAETQSYGLYITLNQLGLMPELPDMKKIHDRFLRAFDVNQTQQWYIQANVPQQQQGDTGQASAEVNLQKEQMSIQGDAAQQEEQHKHELRKMLLDHSLKMQELSMQQRTQMQIASAQMDNQRAIAAMKPKTASNGANK